MEINYRPSLEEIETELGAADAARAKAELAPTAERRDHWQQVADYLEHRAGELMSVRWSA
jgi:acyl-CoA reductase-like NAD-dependent aldehyde dehydrogenase